MLENYVVQHILYTFVQVFMVLDFKVGRLFVER